MADDSGGGGEGGGSSESLPMEDLVEASQALAKALAADRARREAADRIQRESWEAALKEKDAQIDRLRAEAADATKKLQADASRKMRWEAAHELLLGANRKLAELKDADMEDSRTCVETPNSKEVESCTNLTVDHTASDFRKLKHDYETLSSKNDNEVSAIRSDNDSLRSQLDIMQKDYAELLKKKKVETAQATKAALKLQKRVDALKLLAQKKDDVIARLQAEAVGAKKMHNKDLSALLSQKDYVCNQLRIMQQDYTKLLKSKKVLTQKNDHEIVMSRAEAVGAKTNLQLMHFFGKEKYDEIQRQNSWQVESVQTYYTFDVDEPAVTARDKLKNNIPRQTVDEDCISETKALEKDDDGHSRSDEHEDEHSQSGHDKETINNLILKPPGSHKRKRDACNAQTANGKSHGENNRSAEMSDLVKCVFYYGSGTVRTNQLGADLSEFRFVEQDLMAPQTWTVSQLKDWLAANLGLNPETYTVGVHALWTRSSSNIFWYLRPIDRTSEWVRWLQDCESRGTHSIALVLPEPLEVSPPEGEGGYDPGPAKGYEAVLSAPVGRSSACGGSLTTARPQVFKGGN